MPERERIEQQAMAEVVMPMDVRLAWLTLRLWDDGVELADGGRLWAGSADRLAAELSLAKPYLLSLIGDLVRRGDAVRPSGSRGAWVVSAEARGRAEEVWSEWNEGEKEVSD